MLTRFWILLFSFVFSSPLSAAEGNLWVVLSGNGSCRRPVNSRFVPNLINAKLFEAFHQTFTPRGLIRKSDNIIYGCYEWLSPRMQVLDLRGGASMVPIDESELDQFVAERSSGAKRITIIGHSHAGWRAIKLAASRDLLDVVDVPLTLVSMDPVSRVTCQQLREPGCREAPRDITADELSDLNTRTTWLNIYHSPAAVLGSGEIPAAHVNRRIRVNHVRMEDSPVSWQLIADFVTKQQQQVQQQGESL